MGNGLDYRYIERGLETIAYKYAVTSNREHSPFLKLKGNNFMTPEVATVKRLSNDVWFELSYGRGMSDNYLLGVTFMDNKGTDFSDINECCYEFSEVEEVLEKAIGSTVSV